MKRELWLMDPGPFLGIAMDHGFDQFTVRGYFNDAVSVQSDWTKFFRMHARGRPFRAMWLSSDLRYAILFDSDHGFEDPIACYPIWSFNRGDTDRAMEELMEAPWGDEPDIERGPYGIGKTKMFDARSRKGQEHRILVTGVPAVDDHAFRVLNWVREAQDGDATLMLHSCQSMQRTFGMGIKVFDHPVRSRYDNGYPRIMLPNGNQWYSAKPPDEGQRQWLSVIGAKPNDLDVGDRRRLAQIVYDLNLRTLKWAMLNWDRAWDFTVKRDTDIETADDDWEPPPLSLRIPKRDRNVNLLDQYLCDTCTLRHTCPAARKGAICVLPESPAKELTDAFGSRSAKVVIGGLGRLLQLQSERLERAIGAEEAEVTRAETEERAPRFSPEVTKMISTMFTQGVQLAKLLDPTLGPKGVQVGIAINNGQPTRALESPAVLVGGVVRELEKAGISTEDATPDMIRAIAAGEPVDEVVEAHLVEEPSEDF